MSKWLDIRDRFGDDLTPETKLGRLENFSIPKEDAAILRELGLRKAEIAADPKNSERARRWRDANDLQIGRPPIFINEICWNEFVGIEQLRLRTNHPFARDFEEILRREIYLWDNGLGDSVVSPVLECPVVAYDSGFGIDEIVDTVSTDKTSDVVSRHFHVLLEKMDDLSKIHDPEVVVDQERTTQFVDTLREIFDGVLDIQLTGSKGLWFTPWDYLIRVTGIEQTMENLILEPEFIDAMVSRYVDASLVRMKRYNELGLWASNNNNTRVGSGGYGYSSALAAPDKYALNAPTKELWGCGNAQIFASVSPAMHWEFSLKHEMRWLENFGLIYYGCCEPLHLKMDILDRIPRLRKISISPWVDFAVAAERCRGKYVMSCKPSPAIFASDTWDPEAARQDIAGILEKTRGCAIELIMKDISTVRYQPERLVEWARIAEEEINR